MADTIRMVEYYYTMVSDKPGEAARLLGVLSDARVNLLAFSGFPSQRSRRWISCPRIPRRFSPPRRPRGSS